ncbi:FtsX-like permease family protein [Candidatus Dependentiae bacterium]|nr:FtsX-like permease family protein [Candidatus Dependentiae bacterium]
MELKTLLKISFSSLKKNKSRSFLTILGIIVGIAAIITTLAIGYGAEAKLRKRILGMGKNFIFIQAGSIAQEGKTNLTQKKRPNYLRKNDIEILKKQCPEIDFITPIMFARNILSFKANNVYCDIKCGNENYLKVINRKIKLGQFFNKQHYLKSSKVIVIGCKTAKELFGYLNPIGKSIKVKNVIYKVVGVIDKIKYYQGIHDPNFDVYMPLTTAEKQIFKKTNPYIHGIAISAKNRQDMPYIVRKIKRIMRFRHRLSEKQSDDFSIIDQQEIVKAAHQSSNVLNLLLLIIAAISLFVGGIGVMNIMLVSVSERTQEIGIRMAIGASTKIILKQFLVEAITLCSIGGILGIVIGIITPYVINYFTDWLVIHRISSIIISFGITTIIGLIFGFYPAKKAAQLNVVNALQNN